MLERSVATGFSYEVEYVCATHNDHLPELGLPQPITSDEMEVAKSLASVGVSSATVANLLSVGRNAPLTTKQLRNILR